MIRVHTAGAESGGSLSATADAVVAELTAPGWADRANLLPGSRSTASPGTEIVGPTVGEELQTARHRSRRSSRSAASWSTSRFRFRLSFAVGAVVATIHDLLITLAFLAFFRYELSLNVIAAILTITGYSMNDTIVIFDRVRENMRIDAPRQPRQHRQHGGQPDARPDDDHRRPDAAVGASRCSSSAARC